MNVRVNVPDRLVNTVLNTKGIKLNELKSASVENVEILIPKLAHNLLF